MMFVKLYLRTSDIYLITLVSLDPSNEIDGMHLNRANIRRVLHKPSSISVLLEHPFLGGFLSGAVGSVDVWCSARRVIEVVGLNLARGQIFTASIG